MSKTFYFSICSANYMPLARTLHASLIRHQPNATFVLFLADEVPSELNANALPFEVFEAKDLGIENFADMAFRYDIMEFNTAIKPFCFLHLMDRAADCRVVYLDPDIYVTAPLDALGAEFDAGADLILTPHALEPLNDGYDPDDQRIMQTGSYNLGFAAMADATDTRVLLEWWAGHMRTRCISDLPKGLFVDQKFMDMAPAFVERTHVLRHRGYNAAYWNLHERPVSAVEGQFAAGNDPLVFFHFSGVDRKDPNVFSRHQNRFSAEGVGAARLLLEEYKQQLSSHDDSEWRSVPYAYGTFNDGTKIPDAMRRVYRKTYEQPKAGSKAEIFELVPDVFNSPSESLKDHSGAQISKLMHEVWRMRSDLRTAFSLSREQGRKGFAAWYKKDAVDQLGLPPSVVPGAVRPRENSAEHDEPSVERRQIDGELPEAVCVVGYLKTESGLGEAARRKVEALRSAGISVSKRTLRAEGFVNLETDESVADEGNARVLYLHVNADQTLPTLASLPKTTLNGRYRIGYWAWELRTFPANWVDAADSLDEIWVPSQFVADAVRDKIRKPVTLVPHPVSVESGDREKGRLALGIEDPETLLVSSVFDTRSFIKRKNPLGAIEAFRRAFPDPIAANVRLVLKSHGPLQTSAARQVFVEAAQTPGVIVRHQAFSGTDMSDFQEATDVLLSPHRAEGFGLNIAQAMARGKVAVATNWSGNVDFMSAENSMPLNYQLRPLAPGDYPFAENQSWAEPDLDHAAECLRALRENFALRQKIGHTAREHVEKEFSVQHIGTLSKERLDQIFAETLVGNLQT